MIRIRTLIRPALLAVVVGLGTGAAADSQVPFDPSVCSTASSMQSEAAAAQPLPPSLPPAPVWSEPTLLKAYLNWDYWNLDTEAVRDSTGLLHFGNRLWEYGNRTEHHDRFVLNPDGDLVETHLDWEGIGGFPVFTDGSGKHQIGKPAGATQYCGVVDSENNIYIFNTSMETTGWELHYTKLDPAGNTLINWCVITTGADCWNWYLQPVVQSDDTLIATWIRDTADICAITSTDHGVTWSDIQVLLPSASAGEQAVAVKTLVGSDDALHFVWRSRNWSTNVEGAWYAKARSDLSIAVDETRIRTGPTNYPYTSIDARDGIHITFAPTYDVSTTMYYKRVRGDLDLGGASATDAMLTGIPETLFYSGTDKVHYPMNLVDEFGAVHVAYEEGTYGRFTDKDLKYLRICGELGDLDCNETVDLADHARAHACLAGPGITALPADCDPSDFDNADVDNDGDVDLYDWAEFQAAFSGSND